MRVDHKEQNVSKYIRFRSQGRENQDEWVLSRSFTYQSLVKTIDLTVA